jgi:hypothetical protein
MNPRTFLPPIFDLILFAALWSGIYVWSLLDPSNPFGLRALCLATIPSMRPYHYNRQTPSLWRALALGIPACSILLVLLGILTERLVAWADGHLLILIGIGIGSMLVAAAWYVSYWVAAVHLVLGPDQEERSAEDLMSASQRIE